MKGQVPEDVEILGEGVGGGIRKEDTELKAKLDKALTELAKAGEIQKITDKYEKLKGKILLPQ
jgi:polar amino acid transport system substrate-binding protein